MCVCARARACTRLQRCQALVVGLSGGSACGRLDLFVDFAPCRALAAENRSVGGARRNIRVALGVFGTRGVGTLGAARRLPEPAQRPGKELVLICFGHNHAPVTLLRRGLLPPPLRRVPPTSRHGARQAGGRWPWKRGFGVWPAARAAGRRQVVLAPLRHAPQGAQPARQQGQITARCGWRGMEMGRTQRR